MANFTKMFWLNSMGGLTMSKLLSIVVVTALTGCAWLTPTAPFDPVEYSAINKIYTNAEWYKSDCADQAVSKQNFFELKKESQFLVNYSADLPHNDITKSMTINLDKVVDEAYKAYGANEPRTKFYCTLKLNAIRDAAGTIKSAVAQRRRP
jgi:hypothetical protein